MSAKTFNPALELPNQKPRNAQTAKIDAFVRGGSICFSPEPNLTLEIPLEPLSKLADSVSNVAFSRVGENAPLLEAVETLKEDLASHMGIEPERIAQLITDLKNDYSVFREYAQREIRKHGFYSTALVDKDSFAVLRALFVNPDKFYHMVTQVLSELELVEGSADFSDEYEGEDGDEESIQGIQLDDAWENWKQANRAARPGNWYEDSSEDDVNHHPNWPFCHEDHEIAPEDFEAEVSCGVPECKLCPTCYGLEESSEYLAYVAHVNKKVEAVTILAEYYFYLVQIGYMTLKQAYEAKNTDALAAPNPQKWSYLNPFSVRAHLPIHGYAAVLPVMLHIKDEIERMVTQSVCESDRFTALLEVIENFRIAALMEVYFLGKTVDWRSVAYSLAFQKHKAGDRMVALFQNLGFESFELYFLQNKKVPSSCWQEYAVHQILMDRSGG